MWRLQVRRMIHYDLICANDHGFDSWFQSAEGFDRLVAAGQVSCPRCGTTEVRRAVMAPAVAHGTTRPARPLGEPREGIETALAELRRQVEANSEYVGMNFAAEARAIHDGAAPERAIHGEARPDEARKLIEDGVPVAPLPFLPKRKSN